MFSSKLERIPPNKKSPTALRTFLSLRDPEGIRTPGRLLRRQMLYPTELRDHASVKKERQPSCLFFVGVAGFEPTTSCSQSRRDTWLRYTPKLIRFRPLYDVSLMLEVGLEPLREPPVERMARIELASPAWKAGVISHYTTSAYCCDGELRYLDPLINSQVLCL